MMKEIECPICHKNNYIELYTMPPDKTLLTTNHVPLNIFAYFCLSCGKLFSVKVKVERIYTMKPFEWVEKWKRNVNELNL